MERDERWEAKRKHSCLPTKRRPEMAAPPTLRAIHATAIEVPMARPVGTSAQALRTAPLLLIDLETEEGITGHAYMFCYTRMAPGLIAPGLIAAVLADILDAVRGDRVAPVDLSTRLLQRYRLLGGAGDRAHGAGGFRCGLLGCAVFGRRSAAGQLYRVSAPTDPSL
jgi:hypothetical protein